jgi:hypothetical protein
LDTFGSSNGCPNTWATTIPDSLLSPVTTQRSPVSGDIGSEAELLTSYVVLPAPETGCNLLSSQTLTDSDFVDDRPVVAGKMMQKKFNFNILLIFQVV